MKVSFNGRVPDKVLADKNICNRNKVSFELFANKAGSFCAPHNFIRTEK